MKSNRIQKSHGQSIGKPRKTKQRQTFLKLLCTSLLSFIFALSSINAQTTLTGDHIITGNLDVGNAGTKGNLKITGQTGNTALPGLKITGDGGVVFQGAYGIGLIPATGAGTRFMWYPKKAAFRAGVAWGTEWDDSNIGYFSIAFGSSATASGNASTAFGDSTLASGYAATALGTATMASGDSSTALGELTIASGIGSLSSGEETRATGFAATVFGCSAEAQAYASVVIGRNNIVEGTSDSWVNTDPLFVIGNGTGILNDPARYRNAMTVYKNGVIKLFGSSATTPSIVLDPNTSQITVGGQPLIAPNASGYVGIGTATPSQQLSITGNFQLPTTTGPTAGVIYQGSQRFLHTYGTNNLFMGSGSGNFTTSGTGLNTGIGYQTLQNVTTGYQNVGIGYQTLTSVTTARQNMAIGSNTLQGITTQASPNGNNNVAIGTQALQSGTDLISNVAIGANAMRFSNAFNSVGIGEYANGGLGTPGAYNNYNVLIGVNAGAAMSGGNKNSGIGQGTLATLTTGTLNTAIGRRAGDNLTTGSSNIILGAEVSAPSATANGQLNIGNVLYGTGLYNGQSQSSTPVANGHVGIGTSTPQAKLDVQGDMRVAGAIRIPAAGDLSMGTFTSGTQP